MSTLGLGLLAAVPQHVDLAMVPCSAADPEQQWTLPAAGQAGNIVHEATSLCLLASGCNDDARTALVLDDCKAGCLSGHRFAATWTLESATSPTPLGIQSSMMKKLVVDASSARFLGDPPLCLYGWDKDKNTVGHQQWTVVGKTLQVGKSPDGKGFAPHCPVEPCCMGVHHDVIPDGDGGWSVIFFLLAALALYLGGGVALGKRRHQGGGRSRLAEYHPHWSRLQELTGLVQDGVLFARGRMLGRRDARGVREPLRSGGDGGSSSGGGKGRKGRQKERRRDKEAAAAEPEQRPRAIAQPAPAPAPARADGTAAGDGGRWVHIPG